jgi:dihydrodipicolinate synthase/N-acetylneuraminate lyase
MDNPRLVVPLITPYKSGRFDHASMKRLVDHVISGGVDGLFLFGTTGEFQNLGFEEKEEIAKTALAAACGRARIMIGITCPRLEETLQMIDFANALPIYAVVHSPLAITNRGFIDSMDRPLDSILQSVLFYNNPDIQRGRSLPIGEIDILSNSPEIIGIKDSSGNEDYFSKLLRLRKENFEVYQGSETLLLGNTLPLTQGAVAGTANVVPRLFSRLYGDESEQARTQVIELKQRLKRGTKGYMEYVASMKRELADMGILDSPEMVR